MSSPTSIQISPTPEVHVLSVGTLMREWGEKLLHIARTYCELVRRNEDVRAIGARVGRQLRQVADGVLAPEALRLLGGNDLILGAVATLPLHRQLAVASGEELVPVVSRRADGTFNYQMRPVLMLEPEEIAQVIDRADRRIRDQKEQEAYLDRQKQAIAVRSRSVVVKVNPRTKLVAIIGGPAPADIVIDALRSKGLI